jgi:hypothetical protein
VAVVELPGVAKSGTEFTPALFTISLNKELTAEQCSGFSASDSGSKSTDNSVEKPVVSTNVSKQTISGVEYTELDKQTDHGLVKYYHRFVPGITPDDNACYEFAMSVKPLEQKQGDDKAAESSDLEHKDVQENAAFAGLEKILASVNFKGELKSKGVESAKSEKQPIGDKQ